MSGSCDNSSVTSSFLRDEEVADRIRCTVLQRNKKDEKSRSADSFPYGMVIDDGCCLPWLEMVQSTRIALPLNSKRPTVDRRFLCDTNREIVSVIESMILQGLERAGFDINEFNVYCNKYIRILEYNREGSELLPHSDGTKICDETGHKSSHTLLMFLSYCENGGETILMDGKGDWSKQSNLSVSDERRFRHGKEGDIFQDIVDADETHVSVGIQPIVGRIFLFPHDWPHAGGVCESTPKIALRAELTVLRKHGII
mmetsp:Transcript_8669/g.13072  ORF Transcript_8669/g.13072 Transcript_8669/m.13072 type:complete len:256 (-) Transcript_8669:254-1021(-)